MDKWEREARVDRLETLAAAGSIERLVKEGYAAVRADRAATDRPQRPPGS